MSIITIRRLRPIVIFWALAGIMGTIIGAGLYLMWPGFAEQGEVNFSTVAALLHQGYPLYTDINAAERYSLQHGPVAYLFISGIMKLFGASYFTAKLSGICALFLTMVISGIWFFQLLNKTDAICLLGLEFWILLHWHHIFLSRPDSLMLLCVVVSMYVVTTKSNKWVVILGIAVPLGIMINLKIHGVLYFLPVLALAFERLCWRSFLPIGIIAAGIMIAPYLLPQISFSNYLVWLNTSVEMAKLSPAYVIKNFFPKLALSAGLALIPIAIGLIHNVNFNNFYIRNKLFIAVTAVSLIIPSIIAAKPGSGTNHLIPFIPFFFHITIMMINFIYSDRGLVDSTRNSLRNKMGYAILFVFVLSFTFGGIGRLGTLVLPTVTNERTAIIQEITSVEEVYQGKTLEIGYGDYEAYKKYRDFVPLPVFHGKPLLVEAVALGDMKAIGLPTPLSTIEKIEQGVIQVWLIPAGEKPFSLWMFDDSFREAFLQNYKLDKKLHFFDVWIYKNTRN